MFFTKPNINFDQGWYKEPAAPDNPATNGEVFDTAWDASNRSELFGSSSRNLIDTYDAHNKRVEEITGKKFTNPATASFFEFETDDERSQFYKDFGSYTADGGSLGERGYAYRWKEQNYRRKLADLAEQFPDYRDQLLPETTFKERASAMARDSAAKAESAMERSGGGVLPQLSSLAGSAMSGLTDPINIITAPFGFGGVGTGLKGLAMGFLKTGASNAAVEAAVQPFVQADRSAAGMESGALMGAANVGMAFAFGGALDLGIRGTARGLRWSLGYEPVVDAKGVVIGYKKIAPSQPVDPAAPVKAADADPSFISKDLIDKADAEDPTAMRAVAEKSGLINEPLVRSTFDAMDANERMVSSRPSETIADGEHAKGLVQTLRHVNEPELEPMPVVRDGTTLDTIRSFDLGLAEVRAEIRMLKERAPGDAEGLARLEARVAELRVAKFDAQREIMADDLIQAVDQGRMPQELADLVVDHVADKAIQGRVASDLAKMRPTSPTEARHRLAQILSSPDYRPEVPAVPARGKGLARPALDDPYGADAKAQVTSLEKEMAQELDAAGVKREGAAAEGKAKEDGKSTNPVPELETASKIGKAIGDAIEAARKVAPSGTEFRVFSKASELPDNLRAAVEKANAEVDAMFDPVSNAVYLSTAAIDPAGRLHHESVHALKAAGLLTDGEIRLLAERAAKLDDLPFDRAKYEAAYRDRYSEDGLKLALDEEAAAHLVEARSRGIDFGAEINAIADRILQFFERLRNALDGLGFRTADDVIDAILSGEVARRQAIQSVMEAEDLTAVAVRQQPNSEPMFALAQQGKETMRRVASEGVTLPDGSKITGVPLFAIKAFHGSPHDFRKFSLDKVGTGEGAQAYGHGLYFAENESVARSYKDELGGGGSKIVADSPISGELRAWLDKYPDVDVARMMLEMRRDKPGVSELIDEINRLSGARAVPSDGHLYEVRINADPEDFLDWDKPLSQQSEKVRRAVASALPQDVKSAAAAKQHQRDIDIRLSALSSGIDPDGFKPLSSWRRQQLQAEVDGLEAIAPTFNADLYRLRGDQALRDIGVVDSPYVANALREAGIPGIRYLDQGSRTAGEGSRNYVVFDDSLIEIVAKDGVPLKKPGVMFAIRQDQDTGRSMRRDLDQLGYFSGALEAAKGLKQAKGTPEQMLAQLKAGGAKQAELEATGLLKWIEEKSGSRGTGADAGSGAVIDPAVVGPNGDRTSGTTGTADRLKQPSISKSEIIEFLEKNRVGVKEVVYETPPFGSDELPYNSMEALNNAIQEANMRRNYSEANRLGEYVNRGPSWNQHSLDPSNPTYRETVIHLPERVPSFDEYVAFETAKLKKTGQTAELSADDMQYLREAYDREEYMRSMDTTMSRLNFQSGHFPEPNIIGHMMTSMTRLSPADEARLGHGTPTSPGGLKAVGKANPNRPAVYTIDQIQSDWGQKLRDGGVRDEKKIAELKAKIAPLEAARIEAQKAVNLAYDKVKASNKNNPDSNSWDWTEYTEAKSRAVPRDLSLLEAELRTAENQATGHPLVNTTDQWSNTTLRRALRQAAEADADYIAIPSGDTVLSYNPGDTNGMVQFYGRTQARQSFDIGPDLEPVATGQSRGTVEGIVPKNLRKLIQKLDPAAPAPTRIDKLETPSGMKGSGFTLFQLTDAVKSRVLSEGQPMFAMRQDNGRKTAGSDSRKQYVKEDFDAIDAQFQKAGGDERLKLQAKRAALLNAKAHEKVSADIAVFQDVGGQTDPGKAMMFVVENQGQATFQGLATMRDIATQTDLAEMGKMMWEMRKGAVLGDKRRGTAPVKTMLHNVIREAWGQNTGDATAKEFAKALLSRMEARRQRWNHAGGDIKKLEGYAGPQYHDREAWASAGREEIVNYFLQDGVLDRSRMISFETGAPMTDAELSDMLKGIWRNVVSDSAAAFEEGASASAGRPGAKYKQRMEHRVLHFKDADAWLAYNEKYGSGDVYASIVGEAITMNRDIALMERLGANPLLTWERLKADVIREAQNAVASKSLYDEFMGKIEDLRAKRAAIPNAFEALNAKMTKDMETLDQLRDESRTSKRKAFRNRPKIADLTRSLRETVLAIEEALKDGAQTAEQIAITTDIADLMAEMVEAGARNSMSRNPVERTQRLVKRADEMMKSYMGSANVPADDRLAAGMTATRNLLGASTLVYAPFSALADQTTQAMARLLTGLPLKSQITSYVKAFTKMDRQFALDTAIGLESVLPAIHESNRHVGSLNARHISGYVADRSHAFSFLSPMTTAAKIAFSFDFMKDFASIRGAPYTELGEIKQTLLDRHGISPAEWDQIRAAEPEMHRGREHLTHRAIAAAAGPELADKYLGMLYRERSYSTIEGLTRGRTAFVSDMQPGTAQGEALRSIAMFKSFPVSYGMLIFGRLYEEVMKGRAMQPSVIGAAASIFIGGTILGALVIQLKQIAQGKDPRDMTDPKFWAQAFMQSGGLGIYGDFVASSINRQGSGLAGTIAGPVADLGGNVLDLTFGNIAQYASDEKTNAGREAVKLMRRLTPGMIAPWYIRTAVDRMVFDELQKVLDPEAHRSFQSRMRTTKKVGGNDFFWAPGTSEPQRGPNMGAIFGR